MQLQPVFELTQEQMGIDHEVMIDYINGPLRSWLRDQGVQTDFHRAFRLYDLSIAWTGQSYLLVIDRYLTTTKSGQRRRIDVDPESQMPRSTIEVYRVTELPPELPDR